MATDRGNDILAFRSFLDERILQIEPVLTLEEVLELWDYENSTESERDENLAAILTGLDDLKSGQTRAAREVLAELQQKYHGPASS